MFVELIAAFVAGIAAAGVVMLVNRLLGGRLPRWFAAGCCRCRDDCHHDCE